MAKHPRWAHRFLSDEDFEAIVHAITLAERETTAEIRVHLERRIHGARRGAPADALERAQRVFAHLDMHKAAERHGVLIYLALDDRKLAIVGDEGIHRRVGDGYWRRVKDLMVDKLRTAGPRDAILTAIHELGRALGEHFPRRPGQVSVR